jgi:hypothetical protein
MFFLSPSQKIEAAHTISTHSQFFHGTGIIGADHITLLAYLCKLSIKPPGFQSFEDLTAIHTKNQDIATHITHVISFHSHTLNHPKSICIIHNISYSF